MPIEIHIYKLPSGDYDLWIGNFWYLNIGTVEEILKIIEKKLREENNANKV